MSVASATHVARIELPCATVAHLSGVRFAIDSRAIPSPLTPSSVNDATTFVVTATRCVLYAVHTRRFYRVILTNDAHPSLPSVSALMCYCVSLYTNMPSPLQDEGTATLKEALDDVVVRWLATQPLALGLGDRPGAECTGLAAAAARSSPVFSNCAHYAAWRAQNGTDAAAAAAAAATATATHIGEADFAAFTSFSNAPLQRYLEHAEWTPWAHECLLHRLGPSLLNYWFLSRYMSPPQAAVLSHSQTVGAHIRRALEQCPARLWASGVIDTSALIVALAQQQQQQPSAAALNWNNELIARFRNSPSLLHGCDVPEPLRSGSAEWWRSGELWQLVYDYYREQLFVRSEQLARTHLMVPNSWQLQVLDALGIVSARVEGAGYDVTLLQYDAMAQSVRTTLGGASAYSTYEGMAATVSEGDAAQALPAVQLPAQGEIALIQTTFPLPCDRQSIGDYAHVVSPLVLELYRERNAMALVGLPLFEPGRRADFDGAISAGVHSGRFMLLNVHLWTCSELVQFLSSMHAASRAYCNENNGAQPLPPQYTLVLHGCGRQTQRGALALLDHVACNLKLSPLPSVFFDQTPCFMNDALEAVVPSVKELHRRTDVEQLRNEWRYGDQPNAFRLSPADAKALGIECDLVFRGWELLGATARRMLGERLMSIRVETDTPIDARTLRTLTVCSPRVLLVVDGAEPSSVAV